MSKRKKNRIAEAVSVYTEDTIEVPFWAIEKERRCNKRIRDAKERRIRRGDR
jgi:hypothetical protein